MDGALGICWRLLNWYFTGCVNGPLGILRRLLKPYFTRRVMCEQTLRNSLETAETYFLKDERYSACLHNHTGDKLDRLVLIYLTKLSYIKLQLVILYLIDS